ncbi:hypothetical protein ACOME3_004005 [Neoechinorhynchus agilis]
MSLLVFRRFQSVRFSSSVAPIYKWNKPGSPGLSYFVQKSGGRGCLPKVPLAPSRNLGKALNDFGNLSTVCEEAKCPNRAECWSHGTATIMIMGDVCTRACRFCSVKTKARPPPLDSNEPQKVAEAVANSNLFGKRALRYIVITTVTRDDLVDHGCDHFVQCVKELKKRCPNVKVECLTSDFGGNLDLVRKMAIESGLDVYSHNVETVRELQRLMRDRRASFDQSLNVLRTAKEAKSDLLTKSSLMLGVGETDEQVKNTLVALRGIGVDSITFGQYLQPTKNHLKVKEFISDEKFEYWKLEAEKLGFVGVASGKLVRSSYRADKILEAVNFS